MNFAFIEVLTCIFFMYLLLSLMVTAVQELVSSLLRLRSRELERGIYRMLADETQSDLADRFYRHWLIRYLSRDEKKLPSYISRGDFSKAISDIIRISVDTSKTMDDAIGSLPESDTGKLIQSFWQDAKGDMAAFRQMLEGWFDSTMDRVSGWYKRRIQRFIFFIGLAIVIMFNVDTLNMYRTLSDSDSQRASLLEMAHLYTGMYEKNQAEYNRLKDPSIKRNGDDLKQSIDSIQEELIRMNGTGEGLGLGWGKGNHLLSLDISTGWADWLLAFLGWIITALAITLGAPFWFDILSRLMNIRNAGRKPEAKQG